LLRWNLLTRPRWLSHARVQDATLRKLLDLEPLVEPVGAAEIPSTASALRHEVASAERQEIQYGAVKASEGVALSRAVLAAEDAAGTVPSHDDRGQEGGDKDAAEPVGGTSQCLAAPVPADSDARTAQTTSFGLLGAAPAEAVAGKEGMDAPTLDLDGYASDDGQTESETDVDKDEQDDDEAMGADADGAAA
jgi:hypothetical protein